jgi:hypothetical protein
MHVSQQEMQFLALVVEGMQSKEFWITDLHGDPGCGMLLQLPHEAL